MIVDTDKQIVMVVNATGFPLGGFSKLGMMFKEGGVSAGPFSIASCCSGGSRCSWSRDMLIQICKVLAKLKAIVATRRSRLSKGEHNLRGQHQEHGTTADKLKMSRRALEPQPQRATCTLTRQTPHIDLPPTLQPTDICISKSHISVAFMIRFGPLNGAACISFASAYLNKATYGVHKKCRDDLYTSGLQQATSCVPRIGN